jgi:alpha-tubulin suppressor-like RCC1 family protein
LWGSNLNGQLGLPTSVKIVDSPQISENMFDKFVLKAYCGESFTAVIT